MSWVPFTDAYERQLDADFADWRALGVWVLCHETPIFMSGQVAHSDAAASQLQLFGWVTLHGHPIFIGDGGGAGGGGASAKGAHPGAGTPGQAAGQMTPPQQAAYKTAYNAYNSAVNAHKSAIGTPREAAAHQRVLATAANLHAQQQQHSANNIPVPYMSPLTQQRLAGHLAQHQQTSPSHPIHAAAPQPPANPASVASGAPPVGARTMAAAAPHAPASTPPVAVPAPPASVAAYVPSAAQARLIAVTNVAPASTAHGTALAQHTQAYNAYTGAHARWQAAVQAHGANSPAAQQAFARVQSAAQAFQDHRAAMQAAGHQLPAARPAMLARVQSHLPAPAVAAASPAPAPPHVAPAAPRAATRAPAPVVVAPAAQAVSAPHVAPAPPSGLISVASMSPTTRANMVYRSGITPANLAHHDALAGHTAAYNAFTTANARHQANLAAGVTGAPLAASQAKLQSAASAFQNHRAAMQAAGHQLPAQTPVMQARLAAAAAPPIAAPAAHVAPAPVAAPVAAPAPVSVPHVAPTPLMVAPAAVVAPIAPAPPPVAHVPPPVSIPVAPATPAPVPVVAHAAPAIASLAAPVAVAHVAPQAPTAPAPTHVQIRVAPTGSRFAFNAAVQNAKNAGGRFNPATKTWSIPAGHSSLQNPQQQGWVLHNTPAPVVAPTPAAAPHVAPAPAAAPVAHVAPAPVSAALAHLAAQPAPVAPVVAAPLAPAAHVAAPIIAPSAPAPLALARPGVSKLDVLTARDKILADSAANRALKLDSFEHSGMDQRLDPVRDEARFNQRQKDLGNLAVTHAANFDAIARAQGAGSPLAVAAHDAAVLAAKGWQAHQEIALGNIARMQRAITTAPDSMDSALRLARAGNYHGLVAPSPHGLYGDAALHNQIEWYGKRGTEIETGIHHINAANHLASTNAQDRALQVAAHEVRATGGDLIKHETYAHEERRLFAAHPDNPDNPAAARLPGQITPQDIRAERVAIERRADNALGNPTIARLADVRPQTAWYANVDATRDHAALVGALLDADGRHDYALGVHGAGSLEERAAAHEAQNAARALDAYGRSFLENNSGNRTFLPALSTPAARALATHLAQGPDIAGHMSRYDLTGRGEAYRDAAIVAARQNELLAAAARHHAQTGTAASDLARLETRVAAAQALGDPALVAREEAALRAHPANPANTFVPDPAKVAAHARAVADVATAEKALAAKDVAGAQAFAALAPDYNPRSFDPRIGQHYVSASDVAQARTGSIYRSLTPQDWRRQDYDRAQRDADTARGDLDAALTHYKLAPTSDNLHALVAADRAHLEAEQTLVQHHLQMMDASGRQSWWSAPRYAGINAGVIDVSNMHRSGAWSKATATDASLQAAIQGGASPAEVAKLRNDAMIARKALYKDLSTDDKSGHAGMAAALAQAEATQKITSAAASAATRVGTAQKAMDDAARAMRQPGNIPASVSALAAKSGDQVTWKVDPHSGHAYADADAMTPTSQTIGFFKAHPSGPDGKTRWYDSSGNFTASPTWKAYGGQPMAVNLYNEQGFHGKPQLVSKQEIDQLVQDGHIPIARGVSSPRHADDMLTSDRHFAGFGTYGNGSYVGYGADAFKVAKQYTQAGGATYYGVLRKDAKIGEYSALKKEMEREAQTIKDSTLKDFIYNDVGRYAVYKGYDAIDVRAGATARGSLSSPDHYTRYYMTILNRSKVIYSRDYDRA